MKPLVLVVDDDARSGKLAADVLEFHGFETERVESGEAALECIAARPPALVLLDIQLPGIDGVETLRRLRANTTTRGLRIVAVTASAMLEDRRRLVDGGIDEFLTKPIAVQKLVDTVFEQLAAAGIAAPARRRVP